jgi:hypothetical protein
MASGEIPVSGSAVEVTTFPLKFKKVSIDDVEVLSIDTKNKQLHIFVNNGAGKIFNEDLEPGWRFEIRAR